MSSCRVYVGRLSYQAREKDVERFFRGIGRIRDINLKNGFGFVVRKIVVAHSFYHRYSIIHGFYACFLVFSKEFDSPRDADDAVYECNGQEMLGER